MSLVGFGSRSGLPSVAALGLMAGLTACSVAIEEEKTPSTPPKETQAQPKAAPAPGIKEATLEEQPFKILQLSAHEDRGQTILRAKFSSPINQYRHFPLMQPSRIVLDVFGDVKRLAQVQNFRIDTHWLGLLRLSSGDGYLRMVMEVAAGTVPLYVVEPEDGGVRVVIGPVNPAFTAKKDTQLIQNGKRADVRVAEEKPSAGQPSAQQAAAPQPSGPQAPPDKKYTGQRISLDFKDADIKNVFRLLAEVSGLNIVVTGDVQRRVTVRLVDVPWDQAMDLLIDTNGLGKEQIGNVVRISTATAMKAEKDALLAARRSEENVALLETAYFSVNYAKVKDLLDKVKPVMTKHPEANLVADDRSNTLIVRDIKKGIDEARAVVSRLDVRTAQVLIESNLIETTPTFARALGINLQFDAPHHGQNTVDDRSTQIRIPFDAGSPAGSTPFFRVLADRVGALRNLNATLSAAEREGNIKIISRPSVVTLNNVMSTIQSLRILRITLPQSTNIASGTGAAAGAAVATERVNVGIVLSVTPQVSSDGFVLMTITVKSSSIAESATVTGSSSVLPFDELSREALANVLVRDGETIVIGGIMKDTRSTSESGIPYLKDIPVFGWLFKNMRWQKDFEELMVFITPRIVSGGSENLPTAEQLWRQQLKQNEGG